MIETFAVVRRDDFESQKIEKAVVRGLQAKGLEVSDTPELVIAIGGDGTMLDAFRKYQQECNPAYVGIHTGTLGFFADWDKHEYHKLIEGIVNKQPVVEQFALIEVQFESDGKLHTFQCLNEVVVSSLNSITKAQLYVNDVFFESPLGDGVCVCAPCGSTGYNLSLGGAVLHPSLEVMQVTGKAFINNVEHRSLGNPFILGKTEQLDIFLEASEHVIAIDGKQYIFDDVPKVSVKVSSEKISFARYRSYPFWQRVRGKFISKE